MLLAMFASACALPPLQLQVEPTSSNGGRAPSGTIEMLLDVKVDTSNNIHAATATFKGCFEGFPAGSSITSAHVNAGAMGSAGAVVLDLGLKRGQVTFADGTASFITTVPVSPSLANQIILDTSAFYFQVDTASATGALQGQFSRLVITYSAAPPDDHRPKRYRAPMSGDL